MKPRKARKPAPDVCLDCDHPECAAKLGQTEHGFCDDCPTCANLLAATRVAMRRGGLRVRTTTSTSSSADVRTTASRRYHAPLGVDSYGAKTSDREIVEQRSRYGWTLRVREPLTERLNMRMTKREREAWTNATRAAGYASLSDWLRDLANAVAATKRGSSGRGAEPRKSGAAAKRSAGR